MRCNSLQVVLAIAAVAMALFAGTANAGLITQLGILDLTANGGINPATSAAWAAGDTYRFAFTTRGLTQATSSDINYYNAFVQNAADATTVYDIGVDEGVTWKAIASTPTVDARDNTSTNIGVNGTGEAIFLLNNNLVADNYADLWGSASHTTPINKTELNTNPYNTDYGSLWTGTHRNAYPDPNYGTKYGYTWGGVYYGPLGDPGGNSFGGLWPANSGTHWIYRFGFAETKELPIYALSDPLTITDDAPVIPEPSTLAIWGLGLLGLAWFARRRRR